MAQKKKTKRRIQDVVRKHLSCPQIREEKILGKRDDDLEKIDAEI